MSLSPVERLRIATGTLGIALFVTSVVVLHFAPHRLEVSALMVTVSFLAMAFAFSAQGGSG